MEEARRLSGALFDGLTAWAAALRTRLEQGEFASLPPTALGKDYDGLASGEAAIQMLLLDVEYHDELSIDERRDPDVVAGRRLVLADLLQLREQIG
jgi:hypothetical protein